MNRALMSAALASGLLLSSAVSAAVITVDPDTFSSGTDITNAFGGVTLNTVRTGADPNVPTSIESVFSLTDPNATTGTRAFGQTSSDSSWGNGLFEYLRATFAAPVLSVSLDFFANDTGGDANAQLFGFDSGGNLIASSSVGFVTFGQPVTLTVNGSITSIRAYWDEIDRIQNGGLDNLRYTTPEPGTLALLGLGLAGLAASRRRKQ